VRVMARCAEAAATEGRSGHCATIRWRSGNPARGLLWAGFKLAGGVSRFGRYKSRSFLVRFPGGSKGRKGPQSIDQSRRPPAALHLRGTAGNAAKRDKAAVVSAHHSP
jgi:hypothetical protein